MVVPFTGTLAERARVTERMAALTLRPSDTLVLVDNTSRDGPDTVAGHTVCATKISVLRASARRTPGYARNHGAAAGQSEWLVFLDADTMPCADLLDRYFDPMPQPSTALLGGGVIDEEVPEDAPPAARYAYLSRAMSQDVSFSSSDWEYPKSANVACRRKAFEAVCGFCEDMRAAEDAELTYRLKSAGWGIERREKASVVHCSRRTIRGLLSQRAIWGAGGAELDLMYPGAAPARRRPGLLWWALRTSLVGLARALRSRERDAAMIALLEPLDLLAVEFGRSLPNRRPLTVQVWLQTAKRFVGADPSR